MDDADKDLLRQHGVQLQRDMVNLQVIDILIREKIFQEVDRIQINVHYKKHVQIIYIQLII
jgi:hypothetical protein